MPALIIVIDEYAELSDDAPDAIKHADSIARRGRAVAVNLVAATQRPTQKAMTMRHDVKANRGIRRGLCRRWRGCRAPCPSRRRGLRGLGWQQTGHRGGA